MLIYISSLKKAYHYINKSHLRHKTQIYIFLFSFLLIRTNKNMHFSLFSMFYIDETAVSNAKNNIYSQTIFTACNLKFLVDNIE